MFDSSECNQILTNVDTSKVSIANMREKDVGFTIQRKYVKMQNVKIKAFVIKDILKILNTNKNVGLGLNAYTIMMKVI